MKRTESAAVDPDFFQFVVATLSAFADLATIFQAADHSAGGPGGKLDLNSPEADRIDHLRRAYRKMFEAMDEAIGLFAQYDGAMRNADERMRVGFGAFLANFDVREFRRYQRNRQQINQAATEIGLWTANILENLQRHPEFIKAAVLNHTELNDILRGDLTYSEISLRYRELKDRVEDFFEGLLRISNS